METKQSIFSKIAYSCFYLGVVIEVLLVLIDKSAYTNPIEGRIFQLTFLLFFVKVCLTKYSFKEYLMIGLFLFVGVISYLVTGRNEIIRIVMFIAACKNIDMIKCLKLVFWMTVVGCVVIMAASLTGILGTVALTQDYGRGSVETRYVLGMGHPNALQCMVCVLTILGIYLYRSQLRWYHYIGILLINLFFFILTDSKTALITAICALFFFFCIPITQKKNWRWLFVTGNIGILTGSIIISIMSAKDAMCLWHYFWEGATSTKIKFYLFLDKILTGRIHSLIETNNHEGIMDTWSLFSRPENNYYFDMGLVRLFYWYGIIPACLVIAVLIIFAVYLVMNRKMEELVVLSMFALYTVVEAHLVSVYIARNYLFFIFGMYWCHLLQNQRYRK